MKYLFSEEGHADLARLAMLRTLYAFDFDGTLAPIETLPDKTRTPTNVMRLLQGLGQQACVAVISGRQRADLVERLPVNLRYLVGNHGNEGGPLALDEPALRAVCRGWIAQLEQLLAGGAHLIQIEDKGLSLSLHYRLAREREGAARWLADSIEQLEPRPRVIGGKLVFNLLPPGAQTKFEALAEMVAAESADAVLFVGDDDTDELVFAQAPADWVTVRVEMHRASRARYFLHQQSNVAMLLDHLVRHRTAAARKLRAL
jgi:trehalose 6-phosphate phosphatase